MKRALNPNSPRGVGTVPAAARVVLLLMALPSSACGPWFPPTVLDRPGEPLVAPTFVFDLDGLLPTNATVRSAGPVPSQNLHGDDACRERYIAARALLGKDDKAAAETFRQARGLAATCPEAGRGALAAACIGWEARAELNQGHVIAAAELYVQHYATGDPTAGNSLRVVARRLLEERPAVLRSAARRPELCRVVTLYLAARGGPFAASPDPAVSGKWLKAVEAAAVRDLPAADLLAWVCYQHGDFGAAARWLGRASASSPGAAWLRTKLLLRDGKVAEAASTLADAVRRFPLAQQWPKATKYTAETLWGDAGGPRSALDEACGESACLQMSRMEYGEALGLLLRSRYWTDAAYIAERVLPLDEALVCATDSEHPQLRHLVGRRLARNGRHAEARPLLPAHLQPLLDTLEAALRAADPPSLWAAARILRHHGMELVGTELAPDWHVHDGQYDWGYDDDLLRPPTQDVHPLMRFHYRYRAADLAWQAALGMPDDDDATAAVLCEAGTWLKDRDPQAADRFYKALVTRCRGTALGREADRLRWFPALPSAGDRTDG